MVSYNIREFFLEFNEPFSIAHGTRTGTDIIILELKHDDLVAYGEASLPPYLAENKASVTSFINQFFSTFSWSPLLSECLHQLHNSMPGNYAAKACIDIAFHNLFALKAGVPLWKMLGLSDHPLPPCTYTIGMGTPEIIKRKVMAADGFSILKVKLGGGNDKEIIEAIRSVSSLPLCVDVNQGWKNVQEAKEMIDWLSDKNVLFVEQPLPKTEIEGQKYLFQHSALPVIADEFVQIPEDVQKVRGLFHGINIKLMKCGGLAPALKMAALAKEMGLLLLIGSMTETSCGIRAAAQLSVLANWVDLDGPLLTKNNPFPPVTYRSGVLLP